MVCDGGTAPAAPVRLFECVDCGRTYIAAGEACVLCGRATRDVSSDGRGRLTTWTTVTATLAGEEPCVLGWADLDGIGVGVLGRVVGDPAVLQSGLTVHVTQTEGDDGWPRLWLRPDGAA